MITLKWLHAMLFTLACLVLCASPVLFAKPKAANAHTGAPFSMHAKMVEKCTQDGLKIGIGNKANVSKLCACTLAVQAEKLSLGEYWQIQSAAINGQSPRSVPALVRIQPQLDACAKGLQFAIPNQVPTELQRTE